MRIAIYGSKDDYLSMTRLLGAVPELQYRRFDYCHAEDYDRLIELLPKNDCELLVAAMDGAEGMEGVMVARRLCPDLKIVWFSNDKGFGAQAHRLECSYFALKPVSEAVMSKAFKALQGGKR